MTASAASRVFSITALALQLATRPALAQNCYFPNGDLDTAGQSTSCLTDGGACCPLNWQCLRNGLCYDPAAKYWGRYTCTDKSWSADGDCPQFCTQNGTAAGNEAVTRCNDGSWCCDGDRVHSDCCNEPDPEVLDTSDFGPIASITSAWIPTADGSSTSTPKLTLQLSPTDASTTTTTFSPSSLLTTLELVTITTQSASTDAAGMATTVVVIQTATPSPTDTASTNGTPASDSNKNLTIGIAVGVPLLLLTLAYIFYRRTKRNKASDNVKFYPSHNDVETIDMYKPSPNSAEIDSYPIAVAPTKPGHQSQISELSASNYPPQHSPPTTMIGTGTTNPRSPAISSMTTTTTTHTNRDSSSSSSFHGHPLPQYSTVPPSNQHTTAATINSTKPLPQVQEEEYSSGGGPIELWGSWPPVITTHQHQHQYQHQEYQQGPIPQDWTSPSAPASPTASTSASASSAGARTNINAPPAVHTPHRPPEAPARLADSHTDVDRALGSPPPGDKDRGQLGTGLRVVNH